MMTVTEIVAELRFLDAALKAIPGDAEDELDAFVDSDEPPAKALHQTPARSIAELRLKLDMLMDWIESTWADRRDTRLLRSIKADFDRLMT